MKNKFSIITVTKNSARYIRETIESVLNQYTLNCDFELEYYIHDGDSTDGTKDIILEYEKNYDFIKFSSFADKGLYDGLSYCLEKVSGNIVAYINSGDFYNKNSFELINNIFNNRKDISWITGAKFFYNDNSEIIDFSKPYKYRKNLIRKGVYGKYLPFIQQESTFWRSELNKDVDFKFLKTLKLSGDYYIWHCFSKKFELYVLNTYLSGFKYHKNQLTFKETGKTDKYVEEIEKFRDKINLKDIFDIIIDAPIWFILKNLQTIITKTSDNQIYFDLNTSNWSKLNEKNIFCWITELNSNQGEGILGSMFINSLIQNFPNIEIKTFRKKIFIKNQDDLSNNLKIDENLNKSFFDKYLVPILGILYCWGAFLKKKRVIYVNYVPLWNFLIFALVPPKTYFGPITGAMFKGEIKNIEHFTRRYFLPFFYKISLNILKLRGQKLFFSTENLKEILDENTIKKSRFNFFLNGFDNSTYAKEKKQIDMVIYFRLYSSKNSEVLKNIALELCDKFKIYIVGDEINDERIKNLGKIKRPELINILSKTKFSILSSENFSSLFARDCIEKNVSIFYDKNNFVPSIILDQNQHKLFSLDFSDLNLSIKEITKQLKDYNENNIYNVSKFNLDDEIKKDLVRLNF